MFTATEVEKENSRNKSTYQYTNKSLFEQNFRPFSHKKINPCFTDIKRCLTAIFKI